MHDLVVENALIVDGTGGPSFHGGAAVTAGRITAVGTRQGEAARERLDAEGRVLAPGSLDPHTHYDTQVAWDPLVTCSSWHGVTTVVMGNCGVFATMASWAAAFNRTVAEQRALYASREFRGACKEEMERRRIFRGQCAWPGAVLRSASA